MTSPLVRIWQTISIGFIAVISLLPFIGLAPALDLHYAMELLERRGIQKALWNTLVSSSWGALLSLGLAIVLARPFAMYRWRAQRTQRLILLLPYLVPNFVLAIALIQAWNPVTGLLNPLVRFPGGLYGMSGLIWTLGIAHFPVAFLMLEDRWRRFDPSWREAAILSGASRWRSIFKIELPLLIPTLAASWIACVTMNLSTFAIPAWIASPGKIYPLTYKIYQALSLGGAEGIQEASCLALILFVTMLPLLGLQGLLNRISAKNIAVGSSVRTNGDQPRVLKGFSRIAVHGFYSVVALFGWILPLGVLMMSTFFPRGCVATEGWSCLNQMSLQSYRYVLFELPDTPVAFSGSMGYGGLASITILLLAVVWIFLFSLPRILFQSRWLSAVYALLQLPSVAPGAVIAIGLIALGTGLYNTPWIVVLAFVLKYGNVTFQSLRNGTQSFSRSWSESSQLSGATTIQTWSRILLPILSPEMLSGFFLAMIPILGELTMSVFLASPSYKSVGTLLFDLQDYSDQNSAAALCFLLVIAILTLNQSARWLSRGKLGY